MSAMTHRYSTHGDLSAVVHDIEDGTLDAEDLGYLQEALAIRKVWVVIAGGDGEAGEVEGVFTDQARAEEAAERVRQLGPYPLWAVIEEAIVDAVTTPVTVNADGEPT